MALRKFELKNADLSPSTLLYFNAIRSEDSV